jgi:hypothetical protein
MIVAFDPGVTTGVAWLDNSGTFHGDQFEEKELYAWVDTHAHMFKHAQIEKFTINAATIRKVRVYDSLYLIGYLRYASHRDGFPIGYTNPSDVMAAFPDAALKRADMFTKGKGHANDAARHLSSHLVSTRKMDAKLFLPS